MTKFARLETHAPQGFPPHLPFSDKVCSYKARYFIRNIHFSYAGHPPPQQYWNYIKYTSAFQHLYIYIYLVLATALMLCDFGAITPTEMGLIGWDYCGGVGVFLFIFLFISMRNSLHKKTAKECFPPDGCWLQKANFVIPSKHAR